MSKTERKLVGMSTCCTHTLVAWESGRVVGFRIGSPSVKSDLFSSFEPLGSVLCLGMAKISGVTEMSLLTAYWNGTFC